MDEMPTFQRARRPEQRELRRQEILDAAEALLGELPAEEISLRELARRLDVSKTHVVRYFESREGVFLELLNRMRRSWLEAIPAEWSDDADVMQALADSLAARPVMCQLWSMLPTVLERNVSADAVRAYKLVDLGQRTELAAQIAARTPLSADDALLLTEHIVVGLVGLWPFSRPSPALIEATTDEPRLARARVDFPARYGELLRVMLAGMTARHSRTATP